MKRIGLAAPMEPAIARATRTSLTAGGEINFATAANTSFKLVTRCSNCGSPDVRRVPLVRSQGISGITGTTIGLGVAGRGAGLGGSTTSGRIEIELAARLAPPRMRSAGGIGFQRVLFGVIGLVTLTMGLLSVSTGDALPRIVIGLFCLGIALAQHAHARSVAHYNIKVYPGLMERWKNSYICLRCGTITEPGS